MDIKDVLIMLVKLLNRNVFCSLLVVSSLCVGSATTYRDMSLGDMLNSADIAFYGTVSEVNVELRANQQGADEPWTVVNFVVNRTLRGNLEPTIELAFYGGRHEGKVLEVTGMPKFTVGEEVIILAYNSDYYSPIVGFSQGIWRFSSNGFENNEGKILGLNEEGNLVLGQQSAGTEEILIKLTEMLAAGPQSDNKSDAPPDAPKSDTPPSDAPPPDAPPPDAPLNMEQQGMEQ